MASLFGVVRFGWFNAFRVSARNWNTLDSVSAKFLIADRSHLAWPSARIPLNRSADEEGVQFEFLTAPHHAGGFRLQGEECFHGFARAAFGDRFEVLAQQDQGDDHAGCLVVHVRGALREEAGGDGGDQGVPEGGGRPDHHQGVHVWRQGAQALPAQAVKTSARTELDGEGQGEHHPVQRAHHAVPEGGHQPVLGSGHHHGNHGQQQQGDGEDGAEQHLAAHVRHFLGARLTLLILTAQTGLRFKDLVARLADGGLELTGAHAGGQVRDAGAFSGEVDGSAEYPVDFLQGPFDAADAVGAGHALHAQVDVAQDRLVADGLDLVEQRLRCGDGRVVRDGGAFGGQVDGGVFHAVDFLQAAFDSSHAVGAGHALHAQFDGLRHLRSLPPGGGLLMIPAYIQPGRVSNSPTHSALWHAATRCFVLTPLGGGYTVQFGGPPMTQTELTITGMTCGHCQTSVTNTLRAVPGVTDAHVNLSTGTATVHGTAQPDALIAAVLDEGYGAQVAHPK